MRLAIFSVLVLSLLLVAAVLPTPNPMRFLSAGTYFLPGGEHMSVGKVCRRWGERPLDVAVFRSAEDDEATRAAMACSLLKNKDDYVGMHRTEILALFGSASGYYYTEMVPTYLIETAKTRSQNTWQIVFRIDRDRKVTTVVVHKNCC